MNLTHFHIKSTENLGKNNSSVNSKHQICCQNIRHFSQIRSGNTGSNIRVQKKWSCAGRSE